MQRVPSLTCTSLVQALKALQMELARVKQVELEEFLGLDRDHLEFEN
jgi:hypothetical protein